MRISLGGVRDEAEIRGHRRTYIGSMPGKIIQSMKRAGVINPVMLLDEVDKMSMDFRGDPSSALLEVLDPEQNVAFNDHYLDVDYDLSHVMFITTANVRYAIPLPLQDRMEIIELPGYLQHDKREIAKRHIIPKQLEEHGLARQEHRDPRTRRSTRSSPSTRAKPGCATSSARSPPSAARWRRRSCSQGRRTAGRSGHAARREEETSVLSWIRQSRERISACRGSATGRASEQNRVGSVTGLAWTSVGGDILHVDVTVMNGHEKLTLTGQLGDVMKESAQAALSYLRSNAQKLGLPGDVLQREGDPRPSAGRSDPEGRPVGRHHHGDGHVFGGQRTSRRASDVAMTGEITLRGEVLAIGGLEREAPGCTAERHHHGADPAGECEGSVRRSRRGEGRTDAGPDQQDRGGAAVCLRRRAKQKPVKGHMYSTGRLNAYCAGHELSISSPPASGGR